MTTEADEILARELSKIGSVAGSGGGIGARIASRFLGNDSFEISETINTEMEKVLKVVTDILKQQGNIVENIEPTSALPAVHAIVGSGYMNMNPALVSVMVQASSNNKTILLIRGIAKEGLIKQHGGRKAVLRIAELLGSAFQVE